MSAKQMSLVHDTMCAKFVILLSVLDEKLFGWLMKNTFVVNHLFAESRCDELQKIAL